MAPHVLKLSDESQGFMDSVYSHVLVCGAAGSGKTTFAKALSRATGWAMAETSTLLIEMLARIEMAKDWPMPDRLAGALAWIHKIGGPDKSFYRGALRQLGDELRTSCPGLLLEHAAAQGARILVGVRRLSEVEGFLGELRCTRVLPVLVHGREIMNVCAEFEWTRNFEALRHVDNQRGVEAMDEGARVLAGELAANTF